MVMPRLLLLLYLHVSVKVCLMLKSAITLLFAVEQLQEMNLLMHSRRAMLQHGDLNVFGKTK